MTALQVSLRWSATQQMPVGRLAMRDRRILFEYAPSFLAQGLEISPFHLRIAPGVFEERKGVFEGLFGVFNDSLPDGWGRLLMDRHALRIGLDPRALTPLDRLAWVGGRGIGALVYEPEEPLSGDEAVLSLDRLAEEAAVILSGSSTDVLPELLRLGGSPAGARPKVLVAWRERDGHMAHGADDPPQGYRSVLVKFNSRADPKDAGAIEYAYSLMARAAGLPMTRTLLLPSLRGHPGYFATERFDRVGQHRSHVHSLSGLLHADHRAPALDYEAVLRAALHLTKDVRQLQALYRQMVFNVLAHNRDDHAKQFSFLMDQDGRWRVAPAYDLTFSDGPGGEHATTVAGEGRVISRTHMLQVASKVGMRGPEALTILDEVAAAVARWREFASTAGVRRSSTARIAKALVH